LDTQKGKIKILHYRSGKSKGINVGCVANFSYTCIAGLSPCKDNHISSELYYAERYDRNSKLNFFTYACEFIIILSFRVYLKKHISSRVKLPTYHIYFNDSKNII
jgi:hypothetical protein